MRHRIFIAILALLAVPAAVLAQQQDYPIPSEPAGSPAPPAEPPLKPLKPKAALRRAFVIDEVRGKVYFQLPDEARRRRLKGPTTVPMQTIVDAERGRVRLTVARDARGRTSKGVFYDGRFRVSQGAGKRPITHLRLVGEFETACDSASASAPTATASARRKRRRLWGNGKGRFRTRGRYSAATVRGTKWLVEDRCDGTLTKVARGEVEVVDFSVPTSFSQPEGDLQAGAAPAPAMSPAASKPRKVRVRRGGTYVARPGS